MQACKIKPNGTAVLLSSAPFLATIRSTFRCSHFLFRLLSITSGQEEEQDEDEDEDEEEEEEEELRSRSPPPPINATI